MTIEKVVKTDAEWEKLLTIRAIPDHSQERHRTRVQRPILEQSRAGLYRCVACNLDLFGSDTKFESGTGWPSFFQPIIDSHVGTEEDNSLFARRTEVHCARCGSHLGHVSKMAPNRPACAIASIPWP
jgi:peptide-methionine (R)-S-oxide reductase